MKDYSASFGRRGSCILSNMKGANADDDARPIEQDHTTAGEAYRRPDCAAHRTGGLRGAVVATILAVAALLNARPAAAKETAYKHHND
jgi:hypothetical protein